MFSAPMAVGGVVEVQTRGTNLRGSCFAIRRPDCFLTARHVVAGADPGALKIGIGSESETAILDVRFVVEHPRKDIAVLYAPGPRRYVAREEVVSGWREPPREDRERAVFVDDIQPEELLMGVWYEAFGLVTDMPSHLDRGGVGEGRVFRGYIHREMSYRDGWGSYRAIELSEGVPGGASGGPIYDPNAPHRVIALGTATVESVIPGTRATENAVGEVTAQSAEPMRWRVGVGLLLEPVRPWISESIDAITKAH